MVDYLQQTLRLEQQQKMMIRVSYVEVSGECVTDLLSIRRNAKPHIVDKHGREAEMKDVEMKSIQHIQDIETQYILGNRKRSLAYSKKYRKREDSTAVFMLRVEVSDKKGNVRRGRFDLVDLAASEVVSRLE